MSFLRSLRGKFASTLFVAALIAVALPAVAGFVMFALGNPTALTAGQIAFAGTAYAAAVALVGILLTGRTSGSRLVGLPREGLPKASALTHEHTYTEKRLFSTRTETQRCYGNACQWQKHP